MMFQQVHILYKQLHLKVSGAILVVNSIKDTNEQVRRCQICQICTCKEKKEVVPWKPIAIEINFNE